MPRRPTFKRKRRRPPANVHIEIGAIPGVYTIDPNAHKPDGCDIFLYDPKGVDEMRGVAAEALPDVHNGRSDGQKLWVDVQGLGDAELLTTIARTFRIHPLAMEDVVHVGQRPKTDVFQGFMMVIVSMPRPELPFSTEQLSIAIGPDWVVTFQERPGDFFDPIRNRIRDGLGRVRKAPADYLAYALVDAVIDAFFPILGMVGDHIESVEDMLMEGGRNDVASAIHGLRREVTSIRRCVWPIREALRAFGAHEEGFVQPDTRLFIRDADDHAARILDIVDSFKDTANSLMDMHLASVSNSTNDVMQVLTVISTMFIPLTFIAGVYGMNFDPEASPWNMPETKWYWGYPFAMALMGVIAFALVIFFRRRGWLGGRPR